jgi:carbonic anhydrase
MNIFIFTVLTFTLNHANAHFDILTDPQMIRAYDDFNYNDSSEYGPANWAGLCKEGVRQSPILIDSDYIKIIPQTPLRTIGAFNTDPVSIKVNNNGHGATVVFNYNDSNVPQITGGPLNDDIYNFHSFHMHWPCEHSLQDSECSMELHLVHFNSKYGTIANAISQSDGLAVIGIQYIAVINEMENLPFTALIDDVEDYNSVYIESEKVFNYYDVLQNIELTRFYSYLGSLTTPSCGKLE